MSRMRFVIRAVVLGTAMIACWGGAVHAWAQDGDYQNTATCATGPNQLCRSVSVCTVSGNTTTCTTNNYYYT